jgi:hypothetical protein
MALGLIYERDELDDWRGCIASLPPARRSCQRFAEQHGSTTCTRRLDLQAMVAILEYSQYQRPGPADDALETGLPCLLYAGAAEQDAHEYRREAVVEMPNA